MSRLVQSNQLAPYSENQVKSRVKKYQIPYDRAGGHYIFLKEDWESALVDSLMKAGQRRQSAVAKKLHRERKAAENSNGTSTAPKKKAAKKKRTAKKASKKK